VHKGDSNTLNTQINNALKSEGCVQLFGSQHEGVILPYSIMARISGITKKYDFRSNVISGHAVEEYLFATMYINFCKKEVAIICKSFWQEPEMTPSVEQALAETLPAIKRVKRDYNNVIRKAIREKAADYQM